ncbi:MAG: DUF3225 domain-containing protein [Salibacteraceae bacterium]|nr:DUF3225 domain-containing protein [Salibacteraceae bacterium]
MTLKFKVLFFSTIIVFSCSQHKSQQIQSAEIEAIHVVMNRQASAWNNGDIEGYMQGYWNSDSLIFTGGKTKTMGWHQAIRRYRTSYPDKAAMGKLTFSQLETTLTSDLSAYTTGVWILNGDSNAVEGRFTLVWKKMHNQWLIIADHTS